VLDPEATSRSLCDGLHFYGSDGRNLRWRAAAHPLLSSFFHQLNGRHLHTGKARRPSRPGWPKAGQSSPCVPMAWPSRRLRGAWRWGGGSSATGASAFSTSGVRGCPTSPAGVVRHCFPPEVAVHRVKMACERPDQLWRSRSPWDGLELARQREREGMVDGLSAATVRRLLECPPLQPWRHPRWLSPTTPRDTAFGRRMAASVALYPRPLRHDDLVLCEAEQTSRQPRPRRQATRPAKPALPKRVEHAYRRAGAVHLCAAFDPRPGRVYGHCPPRQRPREGITCLAHLDREIPATIKTLPIIGANARAQTGTQAHTWLTTPQRFGVPFTPVQCSGLNPAERWCSIRRRKRWRIVDFASTADLQAQFTPLIAEWNEVAPPFNWTTQSVAKVMADAVAAAA